MGQYLILVKGGKGLQLNKFNAEAKKAFLSDWKEWLSMLKQNGCLVTGAPLAIEGTAINYSGKSETVPDNYDLASETVTGFCIIETKDENKALNILESCTFLKDEFSSCELREFKNMP